MSKVKIDMLLKLRVDGSLKMPNSVYLPTAVHKGFSQFWTNDKKIVKIAGKFLTVLDWTILEEFF